MTGTHQQLNPACLLNGNPHSIPSMHKNCPFVKTRSRAVW